MLLLVVLYQLLSGVLIGLFCALLTEIDAGKGKVILLPIQLVLLHPAIDDGLKDRAEPSSRLIIYKRICVEIF